MKEPEIEIIMDFVMTHEAQLSNDYRKRDIVCKFIRDR